MASGGIKATAIEAVVEAQATVVAPRGIVATAGAIGATVAAWVGSLDDTTATIAMVVAAVVMVVTGALGGIAAKAEAEATIGALEGTMASIAALGGTMAATEAAIAALAGTMAATEAAIGAPGGTMAVATVQAVKEAIAAAWPSAL